MPTQCLLHQPRTDCIAGGRLGTDSARPVLEGVFLVSSKASTKEKKETNKNTARVDAGPCVLSWCPVLVVPGCTADGNCLLSRAQCGAATGQVAEGEGRPQKQAAQGEGQRLIYLFAVH